MFIDRLVDHNNTMVKNTTHLAHTHYIYTVMLKCDNVQIYIYILLCIFYFFFPW